MTKCIRGSAQGLSESAAFTGHGGAVPGGDGLAAQGVEGHLLPLSEVQRSPNLRLFHFPHWHFHTELLLSGCMPVCPQAEQGHALG